MRGQPGEPIIIVGAGLGGLTAAIALRQRGYAVEVYERATRLAEVGAGISLWYNALCTLERLGVAGPVRAVGEIAAVGVIGVSDGRRLVDTDLAALGRAAELRVFHRVELQRALFEQLPKGTVTFGATLTSVAEVPAGVVNLRFDTAAGALERQSWLAVGADGIHSAIRAQLRDDSTRYAGYAAWRGVCPIPAAWNGVCGEFWGNGDRFGVARLPGDRLYWFAVVNTPQGNPSPPGPERKATLLARFGHYAFDVPAIIEATPAEAILFHDIIDRPPTPGWSRGAITLLGDAAHATTPNMGQGAAMAMESAGILARCLAECPSLAAALRAYEATRYPRTTWINQTSLRIGNMAQWTNPLARAARNSVFGLVPNSVRVAQLRRAVDYDVAQVPLVPGVAAS